MTVGGRSGSGSSGGGQSSVGGGSGGVAFSSEGACTYSSGKYNVNLFNSTNTTHLYANSTNYNYTSAFASSGASLTFYNQTYIYYFDCTNFSIVKNGMFGNYIDSKPFPSTCFLIRSSSSYLIVT